MKKGGKPDVVFYNLKNNVCVVFFENALMRILEMPVLHFFHLIRK